MGFFFIIFAWTVPTGWMEYPCAAKIFFLRFDPISGLCFVLFLSNLIQIRLMPLSYGWTDNIAIQNMHNFALGTGL